jgi:hypothetical protein
MRGNGKRTLAAAAIILGIGIILALVLPRDFWWFLLAGILIASGLWFIRC